VTGGTIEIHDEIPDRMLAAKFIPADLLIPQARPEALFGGSQRAA
jgi:hypothetical protein